MNVCSAAQSCDLDQQQFLSVLLLINFKIILRDKSDKKRGITATSEKMFLVF